MRDKTKGKNYHFFLSLSPSPNSSSLFLKLGAPVAPVLLSYGPSPGLRFNPSWVSPERELTLSFAPLARGGGGAGGGGGGGGGGTTRRSLDPVAALPVPPGFVNGLALARSGTLAAVGLGTEPRLGRWGRAGRGGWNGVALHPLVVRGASED